MSASIQIRKNPTLSQVSDMSADARTRNTKTDAELKTLLGIGGAPTAINSASNVKFGLTVGGGVTHAFPASPSAGDRAKYYVTPTGSKTLDFDAAILRPSDSGLSLPKTMTDGKTYIVLMEYNGTAWMLVSLVGGY